MAVDAIFPEPAGVTWIGGTRGLHRLDAGAARGAERPLRTLLRRVTTGSGQQLFGGVWTEGGPVERAEPLSHEDNSLRFEFSTPSFSARRPVQFSTMLAGYDRDWSPWTRESQRDCTNLGGGRYQFRIRSRDLAGGEHDPATFSFRIKPPWYLTVWAYAGYAAIAATLLVATARLRSARLAREKSRLESLVRDRTAALNARTIRLEETRQELENLLGNAWKYTRAAEDPRIEFGSVAGGDGGATVFRVRDNGVGFDMAHAENLFTPFRRLHHDHEFEGTGIGLATVLRAVSRHQNIVWAEARVVFDPRGAEAYVTVHRAPRGEKTALGAVHRALQPKIGE